jgi:hypothetical protein
VPKRAPRFILPVALMCGAGAFLVALGGAYAFVQTQPKPIAPVPIRWIEPADPTFDAVDAEIAEDVDVALANGGNAVVSWPEILQHRSAGRASLRDLAAALGASQLLAIVVRDDGNAKDVRAFLIDEPSGRKRLALTFENLPLKTESQRENLASQIARAL